MIPTADNNTVNAGADMQAEMLACEEALLHTDFSRNPVQLDMLLAPEFIEISSHGAISDRQSVLNWLQKKDPAARWQFADLVVTELTPELRLVRYRAQHILPVRSAGKGSLHSSLWGFSSQLHCWQLRFHQATKIV